MSGKITTHSSIAMQLFNTLQHYHCDAQLLFSQVGLSTTALSDPDVRLEARLLQQIWRQSVELTQDDAFGIQFAKTMHPAALHGLGFAWMASNTLKDAFERLVRYYRLISTAGEVTLEQNHHRYCVSFILPVPKGIAAPASLDAAMGMFLQYCRFTKDPQFSPVNVELQRLQPKNKAAFDAFFNCPIDYDCDVNRLFFDADSLNSTLASANPMLARVNDEVVANYLNQHDKQDIVGRLRAKIIEALVNGTPTQDDIAQSVNMSGRTLQRKLADKGTSFSALLSDIRKELACSYLTQSHRSVGEVTYLLGFSEPANFSRSFKQWTGMTPAAYQANH